MPASSSSPSLTRLLYTSQCAMTGSRGETAQSVRKIAELLYVPHSAFIRARHKVALEHGRDI